MKDIHIIFDLDDTIYDLSEPFRRTHKEIFSERLSEECEDLFRKSRIYSDEALALEKAGKISAKEAFFYRIYRTYRDVGLDLEQETVDLFEKKYRYYQKHITIPSEIKEVLDYCKKMRWQMALFTNGKVQGQGVKIEALNLLHWFQEENIFISEMTGYHKPSLGAFQYVEKHLAVEPQQIWYVGDTYEVDILGGKRAGWNVVWFNHRNRAAPKENAADIIVYKAEELLNVLKQFACE